MKHNLLHFMTYNVIGKTYISNFNKQPTRILQCISVAYWSEGQVFENSWIYFLTFCFLRCCFFNFLYKILVRLSAIVFVLLVFIVFNDFWTNFALLSIWRNVSGQIMYIKNLLWKLCLESHFLYPINILKFLFRRN